MSEVAVFQLAVAGADGHGEFKHGVLASTETGPAGLIHIPLLEERGQFLRRVTLRIDGYEDDVDLLFLIVGEFTLDSHQVG